MFHTKFRSDTGSKCRIDVVLLRVRNVFSETLCRLPSNPAFNLNNSSLYWGGGINPMRPHQRVVYCNFLFYIFLNALSQGILNLDSVSNPISTAKTNLNSEDVECFFLITYNGTLLFFLSCSLKLLNSFRFDDSCIHQSNY
jgi:hypothetical protein